MFNELVAASNAGDAEKITSLLQQGARVLSKNSCGDTGLHVSSEQGHDDIVKLFLEHKAGVNIRGARNYTPLMNAAINGHLTTAQLLIEHKADLELRDSVGYTALMCAARMDFPDIVSELLTRGAQEDITNDDNLTAFQEAEKFGCFDALKMFAAWHDSESRDSKGSKP